MRVKNIDLYKLLRECPVYDKNELNDSYFYLLGEVIGVWFSGSI